MRTDPIKLFEIGITCQYPNIFEPRPAVIARTSTEIDRPPLYSVRFDVEAADFPEGEKQNVLMAYRKYLPNIAITANRPPILTPTGPAAYDVFVNAMNIARMRRLHLDGMLIDMRAKVQVCWFTPSTNSPIDRPVLSFRGFKFDPYDLYQKATED